MERKLLDMMNQLFISEYNSRVEYGAQFQFVKLKILSIERNALLHILFAGGGQLQRTVCRRQLCIRMERPGRSSAGSTVLQPSDTMCRTLFLTYSGKSRISSRFPSFTDTTAVWPGSTSLLVPYW